MTETADIPNTPGSGDPPPSQLLHGHVSPASGEAAVGEDFWRRFVERYESESLLGAQTVARDLVPLFELDEAEFEALMASRVVSQPRLVLRYLHDLLGRGLVESEQSGPESRTARRRRAVWQLLQARSAPEARTPEDGEALARCADARATITGAARIVVSRVLTDSQIRSLEDAVAVCCQMRTAFRLSEAGQAQFAVDIGAGLRTLGNHYSVRREHELAERRYAEAAAEFSRCGDEPSSAWCRDAAVAAMQARTPDADEQVRRLTAMLDDLERGTLAHVETEVALAGVMVDHSDLFGARERVRSITKELRTLGFRAGFDQPPATVLRGWMDAIPARDPSPENAFYSTFSRVLRLHVAVARVAGVCETDAGWGVWFELLRDLTAGVNERIAKSAARTQLLIGDDHHSADDPPGVAPVGAEWLRAETELNRDFKALSDALDHQLPDKAPSEQLLNRAEHLVLAARSYGSRVWISRALWMRSRYLSAAGRDEAAVAALREACDVVSRASDSSERAMSIEAMYQLAWLHLRLGQSGQASSVSGDAIEVIELDRYRASAPFLQSGYLKQLEKVFETGVYSASLAGDQNAVVNRSDLTKARRSVLRIAAVQERSAERTVQTATYDHQLRQVSAEIRRARRHAKAGLAELHERRQRLWDLREVSNSDRKTSRSNLTVAAVQSALREDEAAISYYWLAPSLLMIVTIAPEGCAVERRTVTADQRDLLDGLIEELGSMRGANLSLDEYFISPLGDVLLPDSGREWLHGKRGLAISPHRKLHWFPFAAAPFDGEPLVRRFAVRYVPNLTSLLMNTTMRREPKLLALAVSAFPERETRLHPLSSREEASTIADSYARQGVRTDVRYEPTCAEVLELIEDGGMAQASTLVLATHGSSASAQTPMNSTLELSDDAIDGLEILTWPLVGCELVSLSACNAGQFAVRGRDNEDLPGDEMFGLPAAFLQAGAGAVLAPTWPADDASTKEIMCDFHHLRSGGMPHDRALQEAQCRYLDRHTDQPEGYYWAGIALTSIGTPTGGAHD